VHFRQDEMTPRRLFVLVLFAAILAMSLGPLADPDFWWHLRAGQWMVEHRLILHQDIFSFTRAGQPWIAHEWLAEVIFYLLYRLGGTGLLVLFFALLITAVFALLYLRSDGKPYLAGFALVLGFLATAPLLGVRPQMFTFLLGNLYWYLLERYRREGKWQWLVPLPLLMVLWVNLHGGYALGVFLIGVFGLEAVVECWRRRQEQEAYRYRRQVAWLGIALLTSTLAVMLNPNGARMYRYPFETLGSPTMQTYIQEWFSPDFHLSYWQPLAILLIATSLIALFSSPRLSLANALLLAFFCYAALRSGRHVQFFVLAAVPVLSAGGEQICQKYFPRLATRSEARRGQNALAVALAVVLGLALAGRYRMVLRQQEISEREKFPVEALAWLEQHQPSPNLYNTYDWGGYLIWRLYPQYRVFIDGRADLYGDAFIEEFLSIYRAQAGWEKQLEHYEVRTVLIQPSALLAQALQQSDAWTKAYEDEIAVIFIRR